MTHLLTIPVLATTSFFASAVTADTVTVCPTGCDYTSIQAAIDDASDGDVISLVGGPFDEGAEIDMRGKAITLKGDGKGSSPGNPAVSIQGQGTHRIIACRSGETSQTVLEDLIIIGGLGFGLGGGGLLIEGSSPTIKNCWFLENNIDDSMLGGGVLVNGGSPHFITPRFTENSVLFELSGSGGGMAIMNGGNVTMESPFFHLNSAHVGGGLYVGSGSSCSMTSPLPVLWSISFLFNTAYDVDSNGPLGYQPGLGGGLANFGEVTIQGSSDFTFGNNAAKGTSAMPGLGGGIYHQGTSLVVTEAKFEDNSAGKGGGVYAATSGADLKSTTFTSNSPNGVAGPNGPPPGLRGLPPVVAIDGCTIYGNGDGETDQQIDGVLVMHLGDNHISKHAPPSGCPSDLNGDGQVDAADLGLLLSAWGFCGTP